MKKYMNPKAFYQKYQDEAEITYAWFSARVRALYEINGGDDEILFKSGWYYFLDPAQAVFKTMLKRGWIGKDLDGNINANDLTQEEKNRTRSLKIKL